MRVRFARQPIFDHHDRVVGYELLYRPATPMDGATPDGPRTGPVTDGRLATGQLLSDSLLGDDFRRITTGVPAWVNFPRELLVDGSATLVPAGHIVVEMLEDVPGDPEVVAACRWLKARGYVLAADDVTEPDDPNPLLDVADIIKVDFRGTDGLARRGLARRFRTKRLLAEKVETLPERAEAVDLGFQMLQGFYLDRPAVVQHRAIDRSRLGMLAVVAAISADPMDWDVVERAIKSEVALVDKLLRYLNSAAFAWRRPIGTLREALVLLGERQIRRWLGVIALQALSADRPTEVLTATLLRAHMCEALATDLRGRARPLDLYMTGLYSRMHLLLGTERSATLEQAPLPQEVRSALLDRCGPLWDTVELCTRWAEADWRAAGALTHRLGLPAASPGEAYDTALHAVAHTMAVPALA